MTLSVVLMQPSLPWSAWMVMTLCTIAALWILRGEADTVRARIALATAIAVLIAIPLQAQPVLILCDWDQILEACGGSGVCAKAWWFFNGCYW
jgi:hypothetical protein